MYLPEHLKTYQPTRRFTVSAGGKSARVWEAEIHEEEIGRLVLPTGQIIACDPNYGRWPDELVPYTRFVTPGTYSVVLGLADAQTAQYFASQVYACIHFSNSSPVRWELALLPDQRTDDLESMEYFGFGVDSGMGGFVDENVKHYLALEANQERIGYRGTMVGEVLLEEPTGGNLVVFTPGMGDGSYPCYWGLDLQNQLCCLLADFQILRSPEEFQRIFAAEEEG